MHASIEAAVTYRTETLVMSRASVETRACINRVGGGMLSRRRPSACMRDGDALDARGEPSSGSVTGVCSMHGALRERGGSRAAGCPMQVPVGPRRFCIASAATVSKAQVHRALQNLRPSACATWLVQAGVQVCVHGWHA